LKVKFVAGDSKQSADLLRPKFVKVLPKVTADSSKALIALVQAFDPDPFLGTSLLNPPREPANQLPDASAVVVYV
jgi:hypothetical protein